MKKADVLIKFLSDVSLSENNFTYGGDEIRIHHLCGFKIEGLIIYLFRQENQENSEAGLTETTEKRKKKPSKPEDKVN